MSGSDRDGSRDAPRAGVSSQIVRRSLLYAKKPVIVAFIITLLDLVGIVLVARTIPRTTLVLVLFMEGSIGLIAGAAIVFSSTPSISKIGEVTIGTASWSKKAEKHAEKVAGKWFVASSVIILTGFALSMI